MPMPEEKLFACHRCKKQKPENQGTFKLGKLLFCCKECCKEGEKKDGKKENPNVCRFC